jgi:metal-responsive CopG/Arc/MetJ family transcriptional regulator
MSRTITVKLPRKLAARLSATVKKRQTTQSAIVREALERHLSDRPSKAEPSFLDLAQEYVGCIEGPPDLSSNKRRLAGYGR